METFSGRYYTFNGFDKPAARTETRGTYTRRAMLQRTSLSNTFLGTKS